MNIYSKMPFEFRENYLRKLKDVFVYVGELTFIYRVD